MFDYKGFRVFIVKVGPFECEVSIHFEELKAENNFSSERDAITWAMDLIDKLVVKMRKV